MKTAFEIYKECQPEPKKGERLNSPSMWQLLAMQLYAEQALDLAAEEAEVEEAFSNQYDPNCGVYIVDKQSILKLKEQLK